MEEENRDTAKLYPTAPNASYGAAPAYAYSPHTGPVIAVQQPPQVVVVQHQPVAATHVGLGKHGVPLDQYQVGLCDCCHNPCNCLLAYCCPCHLACKAAKKLDENSCFPCIFGVYPLHLRFRTLVGIKDEMCSEACTFCFCPCCATLRLVNEMHERDFHMHRC